MMTKERFYNESNECAKENGNVTLPKSDQLVCKKFGGICSLINCLDKHNDTTFGKIL